MLKMQTQNPQLYKVPALLAWVTEDHLGLLKNKQTLSIEILQKQLNILEK